MSAALCLCFIQLVIFTVSARNVDVEKISARVENAKNAHLPANEAQKRHIPEAVCVDLDFYLQGDEAAIQRCINNFGWKMDEDQSGFQMRCRSNDSVTYEVPTSQLYQLVMLVPDPNINDPYSIIYNSVVPNSSYVKISPLQRTNYTVYSSVLDEGGTPIMWHFEGSFITRHIPPIKYNTTVKFENTLNMTDGVITWDRNGELDACFEVDTSCNKWNIMTPSSNILPDSLRSVRVEGLPLNDSCRAKVTGMFGTTTHEFLTPITNDTDEAKSQYVKNIYIEATEDGEMWSVRVAWDPPRQNPDMYNVTVLAVNVASVLVNGNDTQVIIPNISGTGLYHVSIESILGKDVAHTSCPALFPAVWRGSGWRWAGAAWGAAAGAAAAALCALRMRARKKPPLAIEPSIEPDKWPEKIVEDRCKDSWEVMSDRVRLHEVVGEGAFGVVRRGTLAPTGREVAVKMLKEFPSPDEMRAFRLEMELMKSVGAHAHVVSLVGCCSGRQPLIIAEYCSQGDLLSFLRCSWDVMVSKRNAKYYNNNIDTSDYRNDLFKCKVQEHSRLVVNKMYDLQGVCDTELTSRDLLSFCRQIAMGMEFLASNRLVHRDLAARNILVTGDRTLKIADFGLSRDIYEENQYKQTGNGKMPVKWMALESLTRRIYTTQSDVWSFGVVVWEVVTVGGAPYPGVPAERLPRLLRAGYRMPRPTNCNTQLYELMQCCWQSSPRERPTFSELHARLDELLNSACADQYLCLELDDEPPPAARPHKYIRMIMRAKRNWTRGETYERPLKVHNHYTSPPATKLPV